MACQNDSGTCVICNETLKERYNVTLCQKGADSINNASESHGSNLRIEGGQTVHKECHKKHSNTI